jgi:hypothetical protein
MMTRAVLLGSVLLLFAIGAGTFGVRRGATAQPPPMPGLPPTYDFDPMTPGTQPPTSPLLAGFEARWLRTHQLSVTALVPKAELQAILPPGFVAQATMEDPNLAAVGLAFVYQQQIERTGVGAVGPSSGVFVVHNALNTTTDPDRVEQLALASLLNDQPTIDALNTAFGPGSGRMAEVEVEITEKAGTLRLSFDVDAGSGLRVKAAAEGPAAIMNRFQFDPGAVAVRWLNEGAMPNPPSRFAVQGNNRSVPTDQANFQFETPNGQLSLPGGTLTITGVGATVTFLWWGEFFNKLE